MVEGNILGTIIVLIIFLASFNFIMLNYTSEQNSFCSENYNVTIASNYSDTLEKLKSCKSDNTNSLGWFMIIVNGPLLTGLGLGIKKMALF
jgi:hypothetical protein